MATTQRPGWWMRIGSLVAVAIFVAACDGGGGSDTIDASVADAATHLPDAAAEVADGALPDAPANAPDAALPDAHAADASVPDAHGADAAVPDAHAADAAVPDAQVPPPHPDASVPPGLACDPVHQAGCGAGQKCDLAASGNFACVPDGSVGDFRVCDPARPNACAAGFTCRETNFGNSRCARFCTVAEQDDLCRSNEPCSSVHTTTDGHEYRMCRAPNACNPILDDCANAAQQCTWNAPGAFCLTPGAVAPGGTCTSSAQCQRGSSCIAGAPGQPMRCFKLCDPAGGTPGCTPGVECTFFATIGPQAIGACGYSLP